MRVQPGDKVKDLVSGFQGIVSVRSEYLNKCVRVGVQPVVDKDGKYCEAQWFDEEQVEIIKSAAVKFAKPAQTGGDRGPIESGALRW